MKYKFEGNTESSKIIKNLATEIDTAKSYIQDMSAASKIDTMSEDKALFLFVNAKLTKFQSNIIRNSAQYEVCSLYPNLLTKKNICFRHFLSHILVILGLEKQT